MQTLFHLLKFEAYLFLIRGILRSLMGFDISIQILFHMCPESGKLFYYKRNKQTNHIEKCYDVPDIIVPEQMCEYLVGRGHLFHAYTEYFNEQERYCVSVEEFLDHYPSWEDVTSHENYYDEDGWTEENHEGFLRLLEWCAKQEVSFQLSWSY